MPITLPWKCPPPPVRELTRSDSCIDTEKRKIPQDDLTNKRLRFAMEVQLTEEERKKFSEAPLWERMLFDQISKVTEEISDVKGQLKVINDEFNSKLAGLKPGFH